MNEQSYLIFELDHGLYGISTDAVQELFFLPELTPVAQALTSVIGIINLRGDILPIIDLYQQLGRKSLPFQLTNSVIVLHWQDQRIGVVVNQVFEVEEIAPNQIQSNHLYVQSIEGETHPLIAGIARVDTTLVTILDPENLVFNANTFSMHPDAGLKQQLHQNLELTDLHTADGNPPSDVTNNSLYAHLSSVERDILRQRSLNLMQSISTQDSAGLMPLAVVGLEGEYFGLGLETIHEFTDIRKTAPVPCCPSHILGNMNLRGEIVTLVDISHVLNLVTSSKKNRQKAIVVRLQDLSVGIAVDDIFDVTYIDPTQVSVPPVAVDASANDYLQGVTSYGGKMLGIINLPRILSGDALVVNEEV